jgi:hypothetical protein
MGSVAATSLRAWWFGFVALAIAWLVAWGRDLSRRRLR